MTVPFQGSQGVSTSLAFGVRFRGRDLGRFSFHEAAKALALSGLLVSGLLVNGLSGCASIDPRFEHQDLLEALGEGSEEGSNQELREGSLREWSVAGKLPNPMLSFLLPWGPKQTEATLNWPLQTLFFRPGKVELAQLDLERVRGWR